MAFDSHSHLSTREKHVLLKKRRNWINRNNNKNRGEKKGKKSWTILNVIPVKQQHVSSLFFIHFKQEKRKKITQEIGKETRSRSKKKNGNSQLSNDLIWVNIEYKKRFLFSQYCKENKIPSFFHLFLVTK